MIRSTHLAVQLDGNTWLVTFVSEIGIAETKRMSAEEFVAIILAERRLT